MSQAAHFDTWSDESDTASLASYLEQDLDNLEVEVEEEQRWECQVCFQEFVVNGTQAFVLTTCCTKKICRPCLRKCVVEFGNKCGVCDTVLHPLDAIAGALSMAEWCRSEQDRRLKELGGEACHDRFSRCTRLECVGLHRRTDVEQSSSCDQSHCGNAICGRCCVPWVPRHVCNDLRLQRRAEERQRREQEEEATARRFAERLAAARAALTENVPPLEVSEESPRPGLLLRALSTLGRVILWPHLHWRYEELRLLKLQDLQNRQAAAAHAAVQLRRRRVQELEDVLEEGRRVRRRLDLHLEVGVSPGDEASLAAYGARIEALHSMAHRREGQHAVQAPGSYRACPRCQVMSQRLGGCSHMTCLNCRMHWCWHCGGGMGMGTVHSCEHHPAPELAPVSTPRVGSVTRNGGESRPVPVPS